MTAFQSLDRAVTQLLTGPSALPSLHRDRCTAQQGGKVMGVTNRSLGRSPEVAADLLLASAPFVVAATPPLKVAIIAGPGGPTTIDHFRAGAEPAAAVGKLSLIHISEPTRLGMISYAVFC